MRISRLFMIGLIIILMLILYSPVTAQDGGQDEPYYIVQQGESLWEIAARFGISVEELQQYQIGYRNSRVRLKINTLKVTCLSSPLLNEFQYRLLPWDHAA